MPKRKPDPACCLCGLPYERIGNNPSPLAKGRCCDACNEIVTETRINPARIRDEIERVTSAMLRIGPDQLHRAALAAICASRGPGLWAAHKAVLMQVREAHAPGDGSEPPTPSQ
jgi:hypothetical protein